MGEDDHPRFHAALTRLRREANAKAVYLLHKSGQQIASSCKTEEIDPLALASLAAGNVAATEGLARLLGERRFTEVYHRGEHDHLHLSLVTDRTFVVVVFDVRSSLGLVRLRLEQRTPELAALVAHLQGGGESSAPLDGITDTDIDALFG